MKNILSLVLLLLTCNVLQAGPFVGHVYSQTSSGRREPLPFAQVYHIEQANLIETDADGVFSLFLTGEATLVATYVGYTRDTVRVHEGIESADFILFGENELDESVVVARQATLSRLKPVRTEVITSAGLCKMACCALAESFENSASVTTGYADAVTGARQIKLLGLSGVYTQMLDENRPVLRGLANPFGLSYIPGQWLESIQIAKGPSSVVNGSEAITGQINMEHRKPTDETPLFVNVFGSTDAMYEANVASALQFSPKWSTIALAHVGGTFHSTDMNHDGFRDAPENLMLSFANRWLYYHPSGFQLRFGVRYINDDRLGGQMSFDKNTPVYEQEAWGSRIKNRGINGYVKAGIPLNEENTSNIAIILDYDHHEMDNVSGRRYFDGKQDSWFANLIWQAAVGEHHRFEAGLTGRGDVYDQRLSTLLYANVQDEHPLDLGSRETSVAAFGEYNLTLDDKLTFVGGINLQYSNLYGWLFTPRTNLKYSFNDNIVVRLLAGRGFRQANLIADNLGVLSTGRTLTLDNGLNLLEDAWTFGGNLTFYLPFGADEDNSYLSLDYFRNEFGNQLIADQELHEGFVHFYNLDNGGHSFTNTWQADFSVEPFERFTVLTTFRYTDARVTLRGQGLVERPMTSRFKGVLNLQYALPMNKWIFDFTAQLNGPMRLPSFAAEAWGMEYSPIYPMLYLQVTKRFSGFDIYVGGENLTNYMQHNAILGADNPYSDEFNASCVWGPLMGIKVYAGLRYTLWK